MQPLMTNPSFTSKGLIFTFLIRHGYFSTVKLGFGSFLNQIRFEIRTFGIKWLALDRQLHHFAQTITRFILREMPKQKKVAHELVGMLEVNEITFICGKHSLRSVQKEMDTKPHSEIVVYNHFPKDNNPLDHYSIAILTSPMNVSAFFSNGGSADQYISIGNTTAEAVSLHNESTSIAKEPNEQSIAHFIKGNT